MRQKEQRLWDRFRANCARELGLQRIENLVGEGMPDVYSLYTGAWVEMKAPTRPTRPTTPLLGEAEGLRVAQKNWIQDAVAHGRAVFVLIRDSEGALFLLPGVFAPVMNAMSLSSIAEQSIAGDWPSIISEIKIRSCKG